MTGFRGGLIICRGFVFEEIKVLRMDTFKCETIKVISKWTLSRVFGQTPITVIFVDNFALVANM
jgi:hypothetical protein